MNPLWALLVACSAPDTKGGEEWVEGDIGEREESTLVEEMAHVPLWAGEAEVEPEVSYSGIGWFVVFDGTEEEAASWQDADEDKILCQLSYNAESHEVAQGCSDCEFAFVLPATSPQLESGNAENCTEYGMDVEHLATKIDKLGYSDGALLVGSDEGWEQTVGDAEYIDGTLRFWHLY